MSELRRKSFTYDTYLNYETPKEVEITAVNTVVEFEIQTNSETLRVCGISAMIETAGGDYNRIAAGVKLASPLLANSITVFPKNFRLKYFVTGNEVSPNDRFFNDIDAPANSTTIKGSLVCTDPGVTYPFKVIIQLQETFKNDVRDQN